MEGVTFVLKGAGQSTDRTLATFNIRRREDGNFYCRMELGDRIKWPEIRQLINLNNWLELVPGSDPQTPSFRTSSKAFADMLFVPRSSAQSKFKNHLESILMKDADGWRVANYALTNDHFDVVFARANKPSKEEDLVQMQVHFMHRIICTAEYG